MQKLVDGTERDDALLQAPAGRAAAIYGYAGDDKLIGSALNDFFDGGDSDARFTGLGKKGFQLVGDDDTIEAGGGDDVILIRGGNDKIDGGSGLDTAIFDDLFTFMVAVNPGTYSRADLPMSNLVINLASRTYSADYRQDGKVISSVVGTIKGFEKITGSNGDDTIIGSGADEFFRPVGGRDSIVGGGGFDILRYDNAAVGLPETYGIIVDFESMTVLDTESRYDDFSDIDQVIGTRHDDKFFGAAGAEVFTGGDGADTFDGGAGTDTVTYRYETGTKGVVIYLYDSVGYDTFGRMDSFVGVENIKGSARRDTIDGDDGANELQGREGVDTIYGLGGNDLIVGDTEPTAKKGFDDDLYGDGGDDTIYGSGGSDRLDGGLGNDSLNGGSGFDTWVGGLTRVLDMTVNLEAGTVVGISEVGTEKDKLKSIENVEGGRGNDVIIGDKHVNVLMGMEGNDTIDGGLGLDDMSGGDGVDAVDYGSSPVAVNADLSSGEAKFAGLSGTEIIDYFENLFGSHFNDTLGGDRGDNRLVGDKGNDKLSGRGGADDLFGGDGNDTIKGDGGNDLLVGGNGADRLFGASGNDDLEGGAGRDTLTGDAGADYFYFSALKDSVVGKDRDTIDDFTRSEHDRIGLEGIDADTSTSGDQNFHFIGNTSFSSTSTHKVYGELRFKGGVVSGDVDGDGKADFEIAVTGMTKMVELDFFL